MGLALRVVHEAWVVLGRRAGDRLFVGSLRARHGVSKADDGGLLCGGIPIVAIGSEREDPLA